jgi:hypothetical protein
MTEPWPRLDELAIAVKGWHARLCLKEHSSSGAREGSHAALFVSLHNQHASFVWRNQHVYVALGRASVPINTMRTLTLACAQIKCYGDTAWRSLTCVCVALKGAERTRQLDQQLRPHIHCLELATHQSTEQPDRDHAAHLTRVDDDWMRGTAYLEPNRALAGTPSEGRWGCEW